MLAKFESLVMFLNSFLFKLRSELFISNFLIIEFKTSKKSLSELSSIIINSKLIFSNFFLHKLVILKLKKEILLNIQILNIQIFFFYFGSINLL